MQRTVATANDASTEVGQVMAARVKCKVCEECCESAFKIFLLLLLERGVSRCLCVAQWSADLKFSANNRL